jgi:hypothetical protein
LANTVQLHKYVFVDVANCSAFISATGMHRKSEKKNKKKRKMDDKKKQRTEERGTRSTELTP